MSNLIILGNLNYHKRVYQSAFQDLDNAFKPFFKLKEQVILSLKRKELMIVLLSIIVENR